MIFSLSLSIEEKTQHVKDRFQARSLKFSSSFLCLVHFCFLWILQPSCPNQQVALNFYRTKEIKNFEKGKFLKTRGKGIFVGYILERRLILRI